MPLVAALGCGPEIAIEKLTASISVAVERTNKICSSHRQAHFAGSVTGAFEESTEIVLEATVDTVGSVTNVPNGFPFRPLVSTCIKQGRSEMEIDLSGRILRLTGCTLVMNEINLFNANEPSCM